MPRYVALLRGINVGGKNQIRMTDLKTCFEAQALEDVATYIQSGNVVFTARAGAPAAIARGLESAIAERFGCQIRVVVRSRAEMRDVVARAPQGFGTKPDMYRYDVIFLNPPLTAASAIKDVPTREGVDQAAAGKGVLYFSRLVAKATQSQLARITGLPIYKNMTIRNWRTTTTLAEMLDGKS
jgi:uncharacterized protein (DUF1697 family)